MWATNGLGWILTAIEHTVLEHLLSKVGRCSYRRLGTSDEDRHRVSGGFASLGTIPIVAVVFLMIEHHARVVAASRQQVEWKLVFDLAGTAYVKATIQMQPQGISSAILSRFDWPVTVMPSTLGQDVSFQDNLAIVMSSVITVGFFFYDLATVHSCNLGIVVSSESLNSQIDRSGPQICPSVSSRSINLFHCIIMGP